MQLTLQLSQPDLFTVARQEEAALKITGEPLGSVRTGVCSVPTWRAREPDLGRGKPRLPHGCIEGVGVGSMEMVSSPVELQGHKGASFSGCVPWTGHHHMTSHTCTTDQAHSRSQGGWQERPVRTGREAPFLCNITPASSTDNC